MTKIDNKKLNIDDQSKNAAAEYFNTACKLYDRDILVSPMIYPLPLCNNNLRNDEGTKRERKGKISVGRMHLSEGPIKNIKGLSVIEISSLIRTEEISWMDMLFDARQTAARSDCFSELFPDDILKRINSDITSSCMGVPFGVSKSIMVKDMSCPWSEPSYDDADAVATLIDNGAVPIGYVKSDPFFFDEDKCASAVASGIPFALGIDHLGRSLASAARNGICAIRPTYGLCSRQGLLCKSPSMQQLSIYATNVHDVAAALSCIMSGKHNDATSYSTYLADWYKQIAAIELNKRTVAIARNALDMKSNPRSTASVIKAAEFLSLMGANVVDIDIPLADPTLSSAIIAGESRIEDIADYGMPLDKLDERAKSELYFKRMLTKNKRILTNARRMRNSLAQSFERVLSNVSVFICPTVLDDGSPSPVLEALALTGICGITIPCGKSGETNLGLLIAGRQFSENDILGIGKIYQGANARLKEVSRRGRRN